MAERLTYAARHERLTNCQRRNRRVGIREWFSIMIALKQEWLANPISCTCEMMVRNDYAMLCGKPTVAAYPVCAGWMALCERHARKHLPHGAIRTDELIAKGATWK